MSKTTTEPAYYSMLDVAFNTFIDPPFSGVTWPYVEPTLPKPPKLPIVSTYQDAISPIGKFMINLIISNYNTENNAEYSVSDFCIIPIPNDQNSRCAFLVFPLELDVRLVFRVYMQLGKEIHLHFRKLKEVEFPFRKDYSSAGAITSIYINKLLGGS